MAVVSKGVNLLPSLTKREQKGEEQKSNLILGTTGITFLVAVITAGILFYNLYLKYQLDGTSISFLNLPGINNQIDDVNDEIDSKQGFLSEYVGVAKKLEFVEEILALRPDYQKTLDRIQALLPEDMEIISYEINESNEISISGLSKDYYTIALFINRASKVDLAEGYFENFELNEAATSGQVVEFSINAVSVLPGSESTQEDVVSGSEETVLEY